MKPRLDEANDTIGRLAAVVEGGACGGAGTAGELPDGDCGVKDTNRMRGEVPMGTGKAGLVIGWGSTAKSAYQNDHSKSKKRMQ